ncbi:MAG: ester cyclase [Fimbriimonadales bacterium]
MTRFWTDVWSEGRAELLPSLFGPGATENGEILDIDAFQQAVHRWRSIFPDFKAEIDEFLPAGDGRVVTRVTYTGTQTRPWAGLPATGKTMRVIGIDIFRVVDGRIIELWHSTDHLEAAIQLGGRLTPVDG